MSQGRSIRLFLVDGTPNGLLTAEIMNWTGHVLTGPRSKLSELVQRPEVGRTGIYFLVGPDPENSLKPLVYIGESDDVGERLKQHNKPEAQNGKDFWERVCLVTSKDKNLTKGHIKYLESKFVALAKNVGRCTLDNSNKKIEYDNLPESDLADMDYFADQVRTIMPVLGFEFLRENRHAISEAVNASAQSVPSPIFELTVAVHGISARAQQVDGDFFVLKGSFARAEWAGAPGHSYKGLHKQLCKDGVLSEAENGLRKFTSDYAFSSPSAGASVVTGRSTNGRTDWVARGSGQSYGQWDANKVEAAASKQPLDLGELFEQTIGA